MTQGLANDDARPGDATPGQDSEMTQGLANASYESKGRAHVPERVGAGGAGGGGDPHRQTQTDKSASEAYALSVARADRGPRGPCISLSRSQPIVTAFPSPNLFGNVVLGESFFLAKACGEASPQKRETINRA
jgi:hypothetical protein